MNHEESFFAIVEKDIKVKMVLSEWKWYVVGLGGTTVASALALHCWLKYKAIRKSLLDERAGRTKAERALRERVQVNIFSNNDFNHFRNSKLKRGMYFLPLVMLIRVFLADVGRLDKVFSHLTRWQRLFSPITCHQHLFKAFLNIHTFGLCLYSMKIRMPAPRKARRKRPEHFQQKSPLHSCWESGQDSFLHVRPTAPTL